MTGRRLKPARERLGAKPIARLEHLVDVAIDNLARGITEESLGCAVPRADLTVGGHGVRAVSCMLEQREEFNFQQEFLLVAGCVRETSDTVPDRSAVLL